MTEKVGSTNLENSPLILIADDESLVREVVVMIVESVGGRALPAEDGLQAVDLFNEHKTEVKAAILDFSMPGLDGFELATKLRELNHKLPIIICSGLQSTSNVKEMEKLGALKFIGKPYDMEELLAALSSACAAA